MSILPLVDLFILLGTGSVAVGFVLKAVSMTTMYNPTFLGFSSIDMVLIAAVAFGLALVITARTWLKLNEPRLQELERELGEQQARRRARARRGEGADEAEREGEVRAAATR